MRSQNRSNRNQQQSRSNKPGSGLKYNSRGQIPITIAQLRDLSVNLPTGFAEAGLALIVDIRSTGTQVGMTASPPVLMPLDDVNRLYSAPRMIASVEAAEKKVSNQTLQMNVLGRLILNDQITDLSKIPEKFGTELVRLKAANEFLEGHIKTLEYVNLDGENKWLKPLLINQTNMIKQVWGEYIRLLARGDSSLSLPDLLRRAGVSSWLYGRLTASTSGITSTMPLLDFFFPKKAERGFSLSIKELQEPLIVKAYEKLLERTKPVLDVIKKPEFVSWFTTSKIDLNDETNNEVKKILRYQVLVVPITPVNDYARNHDSPLRIAGEPNLLSALIAELHALVSGAFPLELAPKESIKAFFGIDAESSPMQSLRESFLRKLTKDHLSALDTEEGLEKFLTKRNFKYNILNLKPKFDMIVVSEKEVKPIKVDTFNLLKTEEKKTLEDPKYKKLLDPLKAKFTLKIKKTKNLISRSELSDEANNFINDLRDDADYVALVPSIIEYLASFANPKLQDAAVKLMAAEYSKKRLLLDEDQSDNKSDDEEEEELQIHF